MTRMFNSASGFTGDISKWDVSSVMDMSAMFASTDFHGDISKWDVSSVTKMNRMLRAAVLFDGDISKWDVSRVVDMTGMFWGATSFNGDISKWDVSSVSDMSAMFAGAIFIGDISKWDVSSVTNMDRMFMDAKSFNHELCGAAWVRSEATKKFMFKGSYGSISKTVCTFFTPQSISMSMSTPKPTIPQVNGGIISPENLTITHPDNTSIVSSTSSASAILSMATSSHTSASTSITTQECGKLMHAVTHIISIAFIIGCCC